MPSPRSRTVRWLAPGAVAVLVLIVSLSFVVSTEGDAPAITLDPAPVETTDPAPIEFAVAHGAPASTAPIDEQDAPRARPASSGAEPEFASVHGLVVDVATGESVADAEVELRLDTRTERLVTDANGVFVSRDGFPHGELGAVVRDDDVEIARVSTAHTLAHGTRDWRIAVPIGPTIRIAAIDGAAVTPDAWRARIIESALDDDVAGEIAVGADGALSIHAPSTSSPDRAWSWRRVRPGPQAWMRYPRAEHEPLRTVGASVEARDDADLRKGRATLRDTTGIQPTVIVETVSYARLDLRIRRPEGRADDPMRAVVFDAYTSSGGSSFEERVVGSDGAVSFDDLTPGSKQVVAWSRRALYADTFTAIAGEALRTSGSCSSEVDSSDIAPSRAAAGIERWIIRPALAETRLRASIGIVDETGLPLDVPSLRSRVLRVRRVQSVLRDGPVSPSSSALTYRFRFTTGAAGNAIVPTIAFGPSGEVAPPRSSASSDTFWFGPRAAFEWTAWAPGMQPAFGRDYHFAKPADGVRVSETRLELGTGFQIFLRAGDPAEFDADPWPWDREAFRRDRAEMGALAAAVVSGIRVRVDTYPAGESDRDGQVSIRHPILPQRITLVGRGWRLCALDRMRGEGARYVAWLRRNP